MVILKQSIKTMQNYATWIQAALSLILKQKVSMRILLMMLKKDLIRQIIKSIGQKSLGLLNRLYFLAFENDTQRTSHSGYYLPNVEIKNYTVMINGENFFDQSVKDNKVTLKTLKTLLLGMEMIRQLVVC